LHSEAHRVQVAQKELDQSLEIISTQQNELNLLLDSLDAEVEQIANEADLNPSDLEREKGYSLIFNLF
jgi:peptidoglycan hydrolase CwlO-like protein